MFGKILNWLKWFLGFEQEETEIIHFLGVRDYYEQQHDLQQPKSDPKYWQPAIIDGVPVYPPIRGLVEAEVLYGKKSIAELEKMIKQCTDPAEKRRMKRIRLKKIHEETQKQRSVK